MIMTDAIFNRFLLILALVLVLFFVFGCGRVKPKEYEAATFRCATIGGIKEISARTFPIGYEAVCKDGTVISGVVKEGQ